ncbi:unnamed protein product [Rotaria socialis]
MFPSSYLKSVIVNGKPTETNLSSIVTDTNHIGLRQHLASNHKILLNDDADLIAESYGLYNVNDFTKEHERSIILCGFEEFKNTSRTTGTTIIQIDDKRLTIAIATTGGKLMKNMKNWINYTRFDGRTIDFVHVYSENYSLKTSRVNIDSRYSPSLNHLCVIIHLFGTVHFVFQMSDAERTKFCGASFQQISTSSETQDLKSNEQQQISDFYATTGTVFPRLVCLMQLYYNASEILERVKDTIIFTEGDSHDLVINENFVNSVANIIKKDYHVYDKTYLPYTENNQVTMDPMVIVEKDVVIAAWKWYEHHLNIATKLFTIDHDFSNKSIIASSLSFSSKPKILKQLIMMLDYNIFPLSAISVKYPVTGQTGIIKNRPALGERALQELLKDNLLKFNYFLLDSRGRVVKSYMKMSIPATDNPFRTQFLNNLLKHDINIDEYRSNYEKCSIPPNNNLSKLSMEIFENCSAFVNQYSKYRNQMNSVIHKHKENNNIEEVEGDIFNVINEYGFSCQFESIENLLLNERKEKTSSRSQTENVIDTSCWASKDIDNSSSAILEEQCNSEQSFADENIYEESSTVSTEQITNKSVNLSYEEYMQSFYPHQNENVSTNNSWTLSNDFINIIKSNLFYTEHVRWNIQRSRACDISEDVTNLRHDVEMLAEQVSEINNSTKTKENNNRQETFQHQSDIGNDKEEDEEKEDRQHEQDEEKEDRQHEQDEVEEVTTLVKSTRARPKRKVQLPENIWESEIYANINHRYCQHRQPPKLISNLNTTTSAYQYDQENKETALDKLALIEYVDKGGHYSDELCNVFRSDMNNKQKISSYGFLATFLNCSVIVGFTEQPCSEGSSYENLKFITEQKAVFFQKIVRRVIHHILTILRFGQLPRAMCYDSVCTLKLFINKHFGSNDLQSTDNKKFLTSLTMAIDRFHARNHTRPMCRTIMQSDHPCHNKVYEFVNTEVAEQVFFIFVKV